MNEEEFISTISEDEELSNLERFNTRSLPILLCLFMKTIEDLYNEMGDPGFGLEPEELESLINSFKILHSCLMLPKLERNKGDKGGR